MFTTVESHLTWLPLTILHTSMSAISRILVSTALSLSALGLSSCVRSDLGDTIDSIGKTVARPLPSRMGSDEYPPFECTVELYRKDGQLYIDMPLVYVPERRMGIDYANPMGSPVGVLTLNTPYTIEELQNLPESRIVITGENLTTKPLPTPNKWGEQGVVCFRGVTLIAEVVNPRYIRMREDSSRGGGVVEFRVVPDFDTSKAEYLGRYNFTDSRQVAQHLPARRSWYNYALMPLTAIGHVADIPLSLLLMPLSFTFKERIEPNINMDYTRVYAPERPEDAISDVVDSSTPKDESGQE